MEGTCSQGTTSVFRERELIDMFMGNLQGLYLDRMMGSTSSDFSDLVLAGERIENMIKMGKIQNPTCMSGLTKKSFIPYGKKREGETNAVVVIQTMTPTYQVLYQQVATVAPIQQVQ